MTNLTSFLDVVKGEFSDSICEKMADYVEDNPGGLNCSTSLVQEPTAARLEDIEIDRVYITDVTGSELRFDVVVIATIEISNRYHSDVETDSDEQWFRAACSCEISNGIKNFRTCGFSIYDPIDNKKTGPFSEYLAPIISKGEMDSVAENFLRKYYPEALSAPTSIDIDVLTERMGLTVRQEHLTKTRSLFGQIFFADSIVPCFDSQAGTYKDVPVSRGTILVDPNVFFMYTFGTYRSTVVHECVHWALHRSFFELQKLYHPETSSIQCQVREGKKEERKRTPVEWMEWQANCLTPRILMPIAQTKAKIEELFSLVRGQFNGAGEADILEQVIIYLADFFDVSKQMAKIRMIDLGYKEAIGVLNYKRTGYIQSYVTNGPGKDLTYDVEPTDIAISFALNPDFREMMESGRYVYVDSHLCVNNPKYIESRYGIAFMTDYARQHMDECCLTFKITWRKHKDYGVSYYTECGLFREALEEGVVEAVYEHNAFNKAVNDAESHTQEFDNYVKQTAAIMSKLPKTFSLTLAYHMDNLHISSHDLAQKSLINVDVIRRYYKGTAKSIPNIRTVIALCVGLQLPPPFCFDLVRKAKYDFSNGDEEDVAFQTIICTMTKNSINECNEMISVLGFTPLSKIPGLYDKEDKIKTRTTSKKK